MADLVGSQDARPERCHICNLLDGDHAVWCSAGVPPVAVPDPAAEIREAVRVLRNLGSTVLADEADVALDAFLVERQQLAKRLESLAGEAEAYLNLERDGEKNYPDALRLNIAEARAALVAVDKEADRD